MSKYTDDIKQLLKLIGGKENIAAVTHCMTRLRFVLNDASLADASKIEELESVKGTFTQAGQFQVIIGNDVAAFYQEFVRYAGVEGVNKDQVKQVARKNQNKLQQVMGVFGEIFAPLIPALVCGGLILGFRNVIGEVKMFENGTMTLADISQFWKGVYSFLWLIGEAIFHFLPVGITWSISKKMGTTQILGIVLGLTLISPQLLNGFAVSQTAPADIPVWNFGFASVQMIGYQGQVIAAILAGFVLVGLEKFFTKICPEVIRMIVVPFFTLVPAVLIAHVIVGPIGWKIGDVIASFVYSGLQSSFRVIFAAVFGFLYAPLVMTGLHHMTNAIDTQLIGQFQGTNLWPMIALSNIAQGSAVLGMILLQRRNSKAQQVNVPACISCYLGVTEPALFGVNMKFGFPLLCGMVGSALAAIVSVFSNVTAISIGVGGLPGILSIYSQYYLPFALSMLIAIVVPVVLVQFFGRRKLTAVDRYGTAEMQHDKRKANSADQNLKQIGNSKSTLEKKTEVNVSDQTIKAPLDGKMVPLAEVPDEVFSKGIMGEGIAVEPTSNTVCAPMDARVEMLMPNSGHAIGLKLKNGMEFLIHVGINTVELKGQGFRVHVKEGDEVKQGQRLIEFDPEVIEKANYPKTTMCIVTEANGRKVIPQTAAMWKQGVTDILKVEEA